MNLLMPPIAPVAFNGIMTFAWIGIFLLVGMILRSVFPPFRKYLIPACIIGGVVGFFIQSLGVLDASGLGMDQRTIQLLVFHLFCLTWTYVGLRVPSKNTSGSKTSSLKVVLFYWGVLFATVYFTIGSTMTVTSVLGASGLNSGPDTMGSLVAYGFLTGPGQALTAANIIESATSFTGLPDFALAGGAMGFAVSIIVGIFLLNIIARKKQIELISCPTEEEECGYYEECTPTDAAGQQTTSTTSIDVLAWHISIGLGSYFLTYVLCVLIYLILPDNLKIYVWTTFYTICAVVAVGVRVFLQKIGKEHLLCNNINTRISNTLVDFLVCGTFISIQIGNISQYWIVYFSSVITAVVVVAAISWVYCARLKEEGPEAFAYLFGMSTGTISTAFILLRLVDPANKSHVPMRLALANIFNLTSVIIIPIIIYMQPLHSTSPWTPIALSFALALVGLIIARLFRQPLLKTAWEPSPTQE